MAREVTVTASGGLQAAVHVGEHVLVADVPAQRGGADTGPSPGELLLTAIGTCKVITVRAYAARRQWPLEGVEARLASRSEGGRTVGVDVDLVLKGPLDDEQRTRLHEVAKACPVSRAVAAGLPITLR